MAVTLEQLAPWSCQPEDEHLEFKEAKPRFDFESEPDFSAQVCPAATLADLHPDAITTFRQMWAATSGNPALAELDTEQLLADAELLLDGEVTYAALILLGTHKALGRHLAQSEVIFEYRSHSGNVAYQQRKEYREAFLLYHDELWATIHLRNDLSTYQERFVRRKIHAFNETAVREAILNAVSHREYRHQGSVFVRQWPRKLEITSPGGFPQGVTPETMLWQQNPRNRRIAESFARCGLVERAGQGANLIFETCIRESKLPPGFQNSDAYQVCMTLDGEVRDTLFVRFLNRAVAEAGRLDADDLLVLDHVHRGLEIPTRVYDRTAALCERDVLEHDGDRFRLSRRMWDRAELNGASPEPPVLVWESPNGTDLDAGGPPDPASGATVPLDRREDLLELLDALEAGLRESSLEPELADELSEDARRLRRQLESDHPNRSILLGKMRMIVEILGQNAAKGELALVARGLLDRIAQLLGG